MDAQQTSSRRVQRALAVGSVVFFIAAAAVGVRLMTHSNIPHAVAAAGVWAPLVFILIKASTIIVAPLGGSPVYLAAVALFGYWKGALLLWCGDMIGYTAAFVLGRKFGHQLLGYLFSEADLKKAGSVVEKIGTWRGFLTARTVLWGFGDVVSYAASLTKLPMSHYLAVSGLLAGINVLAMSGIGKLLVKNAQTYIIVIVCLAVVPLILVTFGKPLRAAASSLYGSVFRV